MPLFRPVGRVRGRIAFGAPIPATLEVERELADILLTEFVPTWRVREGLAGHLPDGWRLVDLYDVWLGSPALAGQVAAADYRIERRPARTGRRSRRPRRALLAATELPRERQKGGSTVRYDLRPLLADVGVVDDGSAGRRCAPGRASTPCSGPGGRRRSSRRSATLSGPSSSSARSCASG